MTYTELRTRMESARKHEELARVDWLQTKEKQHDYGNLALITAAVMYAEASNLRAECEEAFEAFVVTENEDERRAELALASRLESAG